MTLTELEQIRADIKTCALRLQELAAGPCHRCGRDDHRSKYVALKAGFERALFQAEADERVKMQLPVGEFATFEAASPHSPAARRVECVAGAIARFEGRLTYEDLARLGATWHLSDAQLHEALRAAALRRGR